MSDFKVVTPDFLQPLPTIGGASDRLGYSEPQLFSGNIRELHRAKKGKQTFTAATCGGYVLIEANVLDVKSPTINVYNPDDYEFLKLIFLISPDDTTKTLNAMMRFNDQATTGYYYGHSGNGGTWTGATSQTAHKHIFPNYQPDSVLYGEIHICKSSPYNTPHGWHKCVSTGDDGNPSVNTAQSRRSFFKFVNGLAAGGNDDWVSKISLIEPSNFDFAVGSAVYLFGFDGAAATESTVEFTDGVLTDLS